MPHPHTPICHVLEYLNGFLLREGDAVPRPYLPRRCLHLYDSDGCAL